MNNPAMLKMALAFTSLPPFLILLLFAISQGVSAQKWRVLMRSYEICAVTGSTVVIPCTFYHKPDLVVTKVYWGINAVKNVLLHDLSYNQRYKGRVKYSTDKKKNCTLTLSDVRVTDTAHYYTRIETETEGEQWQSSQVSLTVKDIADLIVQTSGAAIEGDQIKMTCKSCFLRQDSKILWKKNGKSLSGKQTNSNEMILPNIRIEDEGNYSCALEGQEDHPSPPVKLNVMYSPRNTSVSVSPAGEILTGAAVTLTCSSDANPPVEKYTWFKKPETVMKGTEKMFKITNITPADSGYYYCEVKNKIGDDTSPAVCLNVQYAPKNTSASSVSLSGEILEGDLVTLTCSSDANPPVQSYTWYKRSESGMLKIATQQNYTISNVRSEHTGYYYCQANNKHGNNDSADIRLNVLYPPKSISSFLNYTGDLKEGSSVTLTCSSDANPPVENYTWYRKTGDETTTVDSGETITFTLTSTTAGLYHCEAKNRIGSQRSAVVDLSLADSGWLRIAVIAAVGVVFFIALIVILAVVEFRRMKRSSDNDSRSVERTTEACHQAAVDNDYVNVNPPNLDHDESEDTSSDETSSDDTSSEDSSDDTSSQDSSEDTSSEDSSDDVKYVTVQFKSPTKQQVASHSTNQKLKRSKPQHKQKQQQDEEEVEYTVVNFSRHTAAINTRAEADVGSVVNKPRKKKN